MAPTLEQRRAAIAAALRAVMAEPPPQPRPDRIQPSPLIYAPREAARGVTYSDSRSIRDALTAEIDWETDDTRDGWSDAAPAPAMAANSAEDEDEDIESPSVPPLDTAGSMSRVASMALFGHA